MEARNIRFKTIDQLLDGDIYNTTIVADASDTEYIIRRLCEGNDIAMVHYDKDSDNEYLIIVDPESGIWCEPAKRDGEYVWVCTPVTIILDGCNMNCMKRIESDFIYTASFDSKQDSDSDLDGFTVSVVEGDAVTTFSYYNSDNQKVKEMAELFSDVF